MIDIGIETNLSAFTDALARYAVETGKTNQEALREQGRLLLVRMVALTPPRNRKQGSDAIRADVDHGIPLKKPEDFDSEQIQTLIREGKYDALNEIMRRSGSPLRFLPFDRRTYFDSRNSRKRINRKKDYSHQSTTEERPRRKMMNQLIGDVGRAKGGWAHSLIKLGGKAPAWIRRHADAGSFEDQSGDPKNPFLRFVNESGWAGSRRGSAAPDAVIRTAMRSRARNIAQDLRRRHTRALRAQLGRASRTARRAVA